jgi:hypothetical protein
MPFYVGAAEAMVPPAYGYIAHCTWFAMPLPLAASCHDGIRDVLMERTNCVSAALCRTVPQCISVCLGCHAAVQLHVCQRGLMCGVIP